MSIRLEMAGFRPVSVLYPQAVGGDIGCGMAVVRLEATRDALAGDVAAARVFAELQQRVPAVRQPKRCDVALPPLSDASLQRRVVRDIQVELGTLGRGNHFLEVQADDADTLWLMVHSGSRALGPQVRDHWLLRGDSVGKGLVALSSAEARAGYLHDHDIAIAFARRNRRALVDAALAALHAAIGVAADRTTERDVLHNFVREEVHDGETVWVHRKGAASAHVGELGVIPGSMGSYSFHVEGRGHAPALCSSSHGAGRRLPRGEAMRTISVRDFERELDGVWFQRELAGKLRDEAPQAYKDIGAVMRAQRDLVKVVRRLRPVLSWKGA
jgi:tRNA-splicing ligase RtcB